jgi:hypothetical protein
MRLERYLRQLARRRKLRFGTVYARIIESQPLPCVINAGDAAERRQLATSKRSA